MDERNCELLFEYLRSILYDPHVQPLDIACLDEPFVKLGKGLQYLEEAVSEMKSYSADISKGNLSASAPSRDNFLCENIKNLQASLAHLTWQAKQVAKGDYSQRVSFLGEFSDAFNTMTAQLKEREEALKQEAMREKAHADMLDHYNQLLQMLIRYGNCDFLVVSAESGMVLYRSSNTITEQQSESVYEHFKRERVCGKTETKEQGAPQAFVWEINVGMQILQITTNQVLWQGERAYVNIILNVTKERLAQGELEQRAYFDKLTKIVNRHYFYIRAEELLKSEASLCICYCDLDHLKYINDTYGHQEGDEYLCSFVKTVKRHIREADLFARLGGDEFCMIFQNCPRDIAEQKLKRMREGFRQKTESLYDRDFSYGILFVPEDHGITDIDILLHQSDELMYVEKKRHHASRQTGCFDQTENNDS